MPISSPAFGQTSLPERALITGASRGIGRSVAIQLAAQGIPVALIARHRSGLEDTARQIQSEGGEVAICSMDLSLPEQVPAQLQTFLDEVGPCSVLINNAGMGYTATTANTPLADWQQVINLNLTAAFLCIQAVLPGMRQRGSGLIINVVSIAGKQAFPGWSVYCASKFGLLGLSRAVAQEERQHGIRVTAFCPGSVDTTLWDTPTVQADFDRSRMLKVDEVACSLVQIVQSPASMVIEELVLMPAGGAF